MNTAVLSTGLPGQDHAPSSVVTSTTAPEPKRAHIGPTFSDQWYRVANLHPRLHAHVQVQRHAYRGEVWHVLNDSITGRQHRINPAAWSLVARLDGQLSLQQVWDAVIQEHGALAPTQPEVLTLLGQLHENNLVASEGKLDLQGLFTQHQQRTRRERLARRNPMAWRLSLFNPSAWLWRLDSVAQFIFNRRSLVVWMLAMCAALLAAGTHSAELHSYALQHVGSPQQLVLLWVLYPLVKAVHEAAHALAVRRWGGNVHDVGVTLMLLVPVPYVDASAANAFRDKSQRIAVSLAGMAAEMALAAVALALWLQAADGLVRDAAFTVMLIGGVSTLLFNGNPLVRMDAYHALADALESPGLGPRSKAYLLYLARRWLLGLSKARPPAAARGEKRWLLAYGLASTVYQWLLALWIVSWLLSVHLVLGALALAWFVVAMLVLPAKALWRWTRTSAELAPNRSRAWAAGMALTVLPLLLVLAVPLPTYTRALGVVWLPEKAVARAGAEGFVEEVLAQDGALVAPGTPLLKLSDPAFDADVAALAARWRGVTSAHHQATLNQSPQTAALTQQMQQLQAEYQRLEQRFAQLTVRAAASGRLALPHAADLPGSWLARGAVVAHVLPEQGTQIRVVVAQDDISRLQQSNFAEGAPTASKIVTPTAAPSEGLAAPSEGRAAPSAGLAAPSVRLAAPSDRSAASSDRSAAPSERPAALVLTSAPETTAPVELNDNRLGAVQVRLASQPGQPLMAQVLSQTPAATRELPSPLMGDRNQGPFATDPADTQQLRTLEPVFTLDLNLPDSSGQRPGTRAWVRFDHGAQPLAWQWLRRVQQLFIGRLTQPA